MTEDWFASWFDTPYYHTLYKYRDDTEARIFIDDLFKALKPDSNHRILDLACGRGRHAIYMNKKGFDVFGVFVLAFVTSVGGGTVRDVLIGNTPVEWMGNNMIIITVVVGAIITLLFNPVVDKINYFVYLFDAIGLGLFTIVRCKASCFGITQVIALGSGNRVRNDPDVIFTKTHGWVGIFGVP